MYVAGIQTKREEGPASIYKENGGIQETGETDARLNSREVRGTVQGVRKP